MCLRLSHSSERSNQRTRVENRLSQGTSYTQLGQLAVCDGIFGPYLPIGTERKNE